MSGDYERGDVVRGPDLFGPHQHRPFVRLNDGSHPFCDREGLYVAVTSTPREAAIHLHDGTFASGALPRESYVNPWTLATISSADVAGVEGRLTTRTTNEIATETPSYLGLSPR